MKVALLTKEYPPQVYGGAGVHVAALALALQGLVDVQVHCFGGPREDPLVARAYDGWPELATGSPYGAALQAMANDLAMAAGVAGADLVHSHTWYANLGGHLAKLLHGLPHVVTAHSLEPLRPWKAEQLAGGYALSSWCERVAVEAADAVIAVSAGMRADVLTAYPAVDPDRVHVIHNGIDPQAWAPLDDTTVHARHGVDPQRPSVVFVGRITRQKGVPDLLRAARDLDASAQLVLCAGQPDTPEIDREVRDLVAELRTTRPGVIWIDAMLPRDDLRALLTTATAFVCPSVYEPFGLVNLEAMACGAPVVATRVGGIPEIVVDGETGLLVAPGDHTALAEAMNTLVADPARARAMGRAARRRVEERFTWASAARATAALYEQLVTAAG